MIRLSWIDSPLGIDMNKILIKAVAGTQCGTEKEGARLKDELMPALKSGQDVELDFDGVEFTSSTFFNASIRPAFDEFGNQFVEDHVRYSNMKPRVQFVLDRTLKVYKAAI